MQILSEQKQFWLNWGWNDHAIHYTLKDFRKVTSFEEEFLYKLLWQDEQGKELEATFEIVPSVAHPVFGIRFISVIRTDSNESVALQEWLFRSMLERALHEIAEREKESIVGLTSY